MKDYYSSVDIESSSKSKQTDSSVFVEYRVTDKWGKWYYLESTVIPVNDSDGRCRSIIHIAQDVTEHKCSEGSFQRQESCFQSIVENSADAIVVMDGYGTILYRSPAYERLLGY